MFGWEPGLRTSGLVEASGVISGVPGVFGGIIVLTDGTNEATAVVYDNATEAAGNEVCKVSLAGATLSRGFTPGVPVVLDQGCYLDLSGTGAAAVVYYY